MYLHREGKTILITWFVFLALIGLAFFYFTPTWVNFISVPILIILFVMVAQFFRVPIRQVLATENQVICPSDGKVVVIEETEENEYFNDKRIQISVFMSPLNVHVQWTPIAGIVKYAKYHPGKFLVAWHPKSSTENERTTLVVKGRNHEVLFRQIAGAVARRIKFYINDGDRVGHGQECGFIKFGSRVDIFLPLGSEIDVKIGDKVKGRKTVLARLK